MTLAVRCAVVRRAWLYAIFLCEAARVLPSACLSNGERTSTRLASPSTAIGQPGPRWSVSERLGENGPFDSYIFLLIFISIHFIASPGDIERLERLDESNRVTSNPASPLMSPWPKPGLSNAGDQVEQHLVKEPRYLGEQPSEPRRQRARLNLAPEDRLDSSLAGPLEKTIPKSFHQSKSLARYRPLFTPLGRQGSMSVGSLLPGTR